MVYHGHEQIEEERFSWKIASRVRKIRQITQEMGHRIGRLLPPHNSGDFFRHALQ